MRRDGACFTPSRRQWAFEKWWMDEEDILALLFIARMNIYALPDRSREGPAIGKRAKNPVFATRSHGKMAPWHPMPPHAPCMGHGPGFRLKFEWGLAGRPDTVGPARDFRVLPHGMIITGQGCYYYYQDLNLAPEL